jgi:hypothetical protein
MKCHLDLSSLLSAFNRNFPWLVWIDTAALGVKVCQSDLSDRWGRLLPPLDVRSRSGIVGGAQMRIRQYKSGMRPLHLKKIIPQPSHELFSSLLGSLQVMVEVDEHE